MGLEHRDTRTLPPETEAAIHPDWEPLYALAPADYQAIINQLTNVVIATIKHLQDAEQADLAHTLAEQAHAILLDYDEDVAQHVRLSACLPTRQADKAGSLVLPDVDTEVEGI